MLDTVLLSRYIVDGGKTDPNGYNIVLKAGTKKCEHNMQVIAAKEATCTENGKVFCQNASTMLIIADI